MMHSLYVRPQDILQIQFCSCRSCFQGLRQPFPFLPRMQSHRYEANLVLDGCIHVNVSLMILRHLLRSRVPASSSAGVRSIASMAQDEVIVLLVSHLQQADAGSGADLSPPVQSVKPTFSYGAQPEDG